MVATVVVLVALAVVTLPSTVGVIRATAAFAAVTGLLIALENAEVLAVIEVVLAGVCLFGIRWLLAAGDASEVVTMSPPGHRWRLGAAAVAIATALIVVAMAAAYDGEWVRGAASAGMLTLLHYRYPIAALLALALLVLGASGAFVLGTVGSDERRHHETLEERRRREERTARRRTDREAAQRRRREARKSS